MNKLYGLAGLAIASALCAPAAAQDPSAPPPAFNPFWVEFDYLGWGVRGDRLPALVTTSPAGTPPPLAGVLGAPGTTVLFGDSAVNDGFRSGGRATVGYWFDPAHRSGIEASFFGLQDASTGFSANSSQYPILAQPFFNILTNSQNSFLTGFPGLVTGSVAASETSRLFGAGALYRQEIGAWGDARFSGLIGYRFLQASDSLAIASVAVGNFGAGPTGFNTSDSFGATSDFSGLDLGVAGKFDRGPWMFEARAKVALGVNFNQSRINGSTTIATGGATTTYPGGLLALTSNIGDYSQTRFAAVPELGLKAGYQFAPGWSLVAGYDLLYWTGVQRAGGLIDTTINPNLIPPPLPAGGPQRPQPMFNTSPLLAQGLSLGVKYEF